MSATPAETVYAVLGEIADVPVSEIRDDQDLIADLGIDSPNALRLLVALEDRLGIEISDEDAAAMNTVGDIVRGVSR